MTVSTILYKDDPTNKVWSLFQSGPLKGKLKQGYPSRPGESYPGMDPNSSKYVDTVRAIAENMDSLVDHTPVNHFAPKSGVSSSFKVICSVTGSLGTPSGHVNYDNALLRTKELNLSKSALSNLDEIVMDLYYDVVYEKAEYGNIKVNSKSSSGLPEGTFDRNVKLQRARHVLANFDDFAVATERGDVDTLLNKYSCVYAYVQNYRGQPDTFGKPRWADSLEYAITGGREGERIAVDKSFVNKYSQVVEGMQTMRPRHVMGMCNAINLVIHTFATPTANYYLNEFKYTWKHTDKWQIADKINEYLVEFPEGVIVGVDVASYDKSVPTSLREHHFENLHKKNRLSEALVNIARKAAYAPVFQPETGDGLGAVFHGNPLKNEALPSPGILSGHAMVSMEGKHYNVGQTGCLLNYMTNHTFIKTHEDWKQFLKGKKNIRMLNAGDDGILMFPNQQMADKFFSEETMKHSLLKIEPEASLQFLGYTFTEEVVGGRRRVTPHQNLVSMGKGLFAREKPWTHKLRKDFFAIGLAEMFDIYKEAPSYDIWRKVLDVEWTKRMGSTFSAYVEYIIENNRHMKPIAMTEADRLYLANPDAIHYKLDADTVSKHVLDLDYDTLSLDDYQHLIGKHLLIPPTIMTPS